MDNSKKGGLVDRELFDKTLYKYRDFELGLKILNGLKLKLTKPLELNDPSELIPNLDNELWINNGLKEVIKKMMNETAVFSLSEDSEKTTMWAHYADNFKGICIGFNTKSLWKGNLLYQVSYQNSRPKIEATNLKQQVLNDNYTELTEFVNELVMTKSYDWISESEYRFLFRLTGEDISKELSLSSIKSTDISEVILGARIEEAQLVNLHRTLNSDEYKHVRVFGLEFSNKTDYSIKTYGIDKTNILSHQNRLNI